MSILLTAALLPPMLLIFWVYKNDKVEKEPPGLIIKLLILGVISTFAAVIMETIGINVTNFLFSGLSPAVYNAIFYFIVVGLSEELVKFAAMYIGTWRNRNFNYTFDAILYGAAAALGFAAFENVGYVMNEVFGGLHVAALRSVTAIPGHCIFGIYMGYYYGMAKFWSLRGQQGRARSAMIKSIIVPTLLHGAYDYCAASGNEMLTIVFFIYIIILDVFAYKHIKKMSKMDMPLDVPGVPR